MPGVQRVCARLRRKKPSTPTGGALARARIRADTGAGRRIEEEGGVSTHIGGGRGGAPRVPDRRQVPPQTAVSTDAAPSPPQSQSHPGPGPGTRPAGGRGGEGPVARAGAITGGRARHASTARRARGTVGLIAVASRAPRVYCARRGGLRVWSDRRARRGPRFEFARLTGRSRARCGVCQAAGDRGRATTGDRRLGARARSPPAPPARRVRCPTDIGAEEDAGVLGVREGRSQTCPRRTAAAWRGRTLRMWSTDGRREEIAARCTVRPDQLLGQSPRYEMGERAAVGRRGDRPPGRATHGRPGDGVGVCVCGGGVRGGGRKTTGVRQTRLESGPLGCGGGRQKRGRRQGPSRSVRWPQP